MEEVWKDINGFSNYQVSNVGRVKSLARYRKSKANSKSFQKERILKPCLSGCGYMIVTLTNNNNKKKNLLLHRVIAIAFIDNPDRKKTVNHIDGDKTNNRIDNLEWNTYSDNCKHAYDIGLNHQKSGEGNVLSKYTESDVLRVRSLAGKYSNIQISKITGVNKGSVSDIIRRKTWRHI